MKKFLIFAKENLLTPLIGLLVLVAIWYAIFKSGLWAPYILPSPFSVFDYLCENFADGVLPSAIWVTLRRLIIGYAIGLLIGVPLGVLCARSKIFRDSLGLLALGLQALPSVCWVPLAILWFGQSDEAMLFVVLMGTIWSLVISTQHGVMSIPPIYIRAAKTMGSKGLHTWCKVIMPAAFPSIVGGMKQGWAFAWRSLMAAEIYVTILSGVGIGQLLHYGRENMDMAQVIGIMIVVVVIGLLADKILFSPWERMLRKRWGLD